MSNIKVEDINNFYSEALQKSKDYEQNGWSKPEQNSLVNNVIKEYVEEKLQGHAIVLVDIGCGTGMLGDLLESNFNKTNHFKYIGMDLNQKFHDINLSKGRTIYAKNIIEEDFNVLVGENCEKIAVFSGIFAVFPKDQIVPVINRALQWYDTVFCYMLDSELCSFLEEDRHNYLTQDMESRIKAVGVTKVKFPSIYHSVLILRGNR